MKGNYVPADVNSGLIFNMETDAEAADAQMKGAGIKIS